MEECLIFKVNKKQPSFQAQASPELGTAQPQLVTINLTKFQELIIYWLIDLTIGGTSICTSLFGLLF